MPVLSLGAALGPHGHAHAAPVMGPATSTTSTASTASTASSRSAATGAAALATPTAAGGALARHNLTAIQTADGSAPVPVTVAAATGSPGKPRHPAGHAGAAADPASPAPRPASLFELAQQQQQQAQEQARPQKGGGAAAAAVLASSFAISAEGTFIAPKFALNSHGLVVAPGVAPEPRHGAAKAAARGGNGSGASAKADAPGAPAHAGAANGGGDVDGDAAGLGSAHATAADGEAAAGVSARVTVPLSSADVVPLSLIGRGSSGTVYKAWHIPLRRLVALKTISINEQVKRRQIYTEIEAFVSFRSRNITRFLGAFFERDNEVCLALEFMAGGSAQDWIDAHGAMDELQTGFLLEQGLRGLHALHARRWVHRDVKPHNMLLSLPDGAVKLADFGIVGRVARVSRAKAFGEAQARTGTGFAADSAADAAAAATAAAAGAEGEDEGKDDGEVPRGIAAAAAEVDCDEYPDDFQDFDLFSIVEDAEEEEENEDEDDSAEAATDKAGDKSATAEPSAAAAAARTSRPGSAAIVDPLSLYPAEPLTDAEGCTTFVGTLIYMAPERMLGRVYSLASDIWSLGLSALTCRLGEFPLPSGDHFSVMAAVTTEGVENLLDLPQVLARFPFLAAADSTRGSALAGVRVVTDATATAAAAHAAAAAGDGERGAAAAAGAAGDASDVLALPMLPSPHLIALIRSCLHIDPARRPTALELLKSSFMRRLRTRLTAPLPPRPAPQQATEDAGALSLSDSLDTTIARADRGAGGLNGTLNATLTGALTGTLSGTLTGGAAATGKPGSLFARATAALASGATGAAAPGAPAQTRLVSPFAADFAEAGLKAVVAARRTPRVVRPGSATARAAAAEVEAAAHARKEALEAATAIAKATLAAQLYADGASAASAPAVASMAGKSKGDGVGEDITAGVWLLPPTGDLFATASGSQSQSKELSIPGGGLSQLGAAAPVLPLAAGSVPANTGAGAGDYDDEAFIGDKTFALMGKTTIMASAAAAATHATAAADTRAPSGLLAAIATAVGLSEDEVTAVWDTAAAAAVAAAAKAEAEAKASAAPAETGDAKNA